MAYEWITDALDETWREIDRLLASRSPQDFERPTACPGWSVQDVLSHLLGFEMMLRGESAPSSTAVERDYVKNPIGELNEVYVEGFRSYPGTEVLSLFRTQCASSLERLRELSEKEWEKVGWSPEGDKPYFRFMETRVLDSWIHLQDIRDALLEPADDHGAGEEIVVNRFESALPYILAKKVKAPDGTLVQINLSGRLARTVLLRVQGGRVEPVEMAAEMPTFELTTPVALFWRRAAGRISAKAFLSASATDVRGDLAMASAFAEALAIMI